MIKVNQTCNKFKTQIMNKFQKPIITIEPAYFKFHRRAAEPQRFVQKNNPFWFIAD